MRAADERKLGLVVVGGHAVNAYAELYSPRIPELADFLPFVSKDADLLGTLEEGIALAAQLELPWRKNPTKGGMRGLCLGSIAMPFDLEAKVEVLGQINGAKREEVQATALALELNGMRFRIINPFLLYEAKGSNLVRIEQARPTSKRQDARHFAMTGLVVTRLLSDSLADAANPAASKAFVSSANRLMNWWLRGDGLALIAAGASKPTVLLPLEVMRAHPVEAVRNVALKRWPHFERQLESALPTVPARILAKLAADLADLRESLETTRRVREASARYLVPA